MIRCSKCEFENKDNAKFCKKCGAKLNNFEKQKEGLKRIGEELKRKETVEKELPTAEVVKEYMPVLKKETLAETKRRESERLTNCKYLLVIGVIILIIGIVVIPFATPSDAITIQQFEDKYETFGEGGESYETVRVKGKITSLMYNPSNHFTYVTLDMLGSYYVDGDVTDEYEVGDYVIVTNTADENGRLFGSDRGWEIERAYDYSWLGWVMIILGIIVIIFSAIAYSGAKGVPLTSDGGKGAGQVAAAFLDRPFGIPHCCIVGIAYGTPEGKELTTLRKWRDKKLSKNKVGRTLIKTYYTLCPILLIFIIKSEKMKAFTRMLVNPFVNFATATL